MVEITRQALVPYTAVEMYRLVHDVAAYPEFLSWCTAAQVLEQSAEMQLASLTVRVGGLRQAFTTRNRLIPGERLTMSLVEGPFRELNGEWLFQPLGEAGSRVSLSLTFQLSSTLVSPAFRSGFARIADRMVRDFCQRARLVYARDKRHD